MFQNQSQIASWGVCMVCIRASEKVVHPLAQQIDQGCLPEHFLLSAIFYFCVSGISTPSQEDIPDNANSCALKTALENFTTDMKRKFEVSVH